MKILFHGTTKSNLKRVYNEEGKGVNPWRLGESDKMYFVDLSKPESYRENKYDTTPCMDKPDRNRAIKKAFNQAKLQSCFNDDVEIYVLECEVPKELVEPDGSFEGSPDSQIDINKFNLEFVFKVHKILINKFCKPEYVMGMWENGCCNRDALPEDLQEYIRKVIMTRDKEDRPRHQLSDAVVDWDKWQTSDHVKFM